MKKYRPWKRSLNGLRNISVFDTQKDYLIESNISNATGDHYEKPINTD
jgi:hypothetical protein